MPKATVTSPSLPVACFAPPLTDELLARYRVLSVDLEQSPVRDAMLELLACVEKWWELPESTRKDVTRFAIQHQGKPAEFAVQPLEEQYVKELYDVTPWMYELEGVSNSQGTGIFDGLPAGELRNAAFHLLWHVKEITLDREPLTQDKL